VKRHNDRRTGDNTALEQLGNRHGAIRPCLLEGYNYKLPFFKQYPVRVLNDPGLPLAAQEKVSQHLWCLAAPDLWTM